MSAGQLFNVQMVGSLCLLIFLYSPLLDFSMASTGALASLAWAVLCLPSGLPRQIPDLLRLLLDLIVPFKLKSLQRYRPLYRIATLLNITLIPSL